MAEKISSAHIRAALQLRYPKGEHCLMYEVAPATGGGTRYADAVAVGLWSSHGHKIEGIEVKVSRSDFLSEMKQPGKSAPVFQYCDFWWLACPKDMVKPDELPKTWGLLELQENGTLRVKVKAPRLEPAPITLAFFASLCRRACGPDEEAMSTMLRQKEYQLSLNFEERVKRAVDDRVSHRIKEVEEVGKIIDAIKEETGLDLRAYENREIIPAIKLVQRLNSGWHGSTLPQLITALQQVVKTINESGLVVTDGKG